MTDEKRPLGARILDAAYAVGIIMGAYVASIFLGKLIVWLWPVFRSAGACPMGVEDCPSALGTLVPIIPLMIGILGFIGIVGVAIQALQMKTSEQPHKKG